MFFFPSGFKVDRHVLQGMALSGAVRQDTFGKLPDVPVPKKMNSIPGAGGGKGGELSVSGMNSGAQEIPYRSSLKARYKGTNSSMAIETPLKRQSNCKVSTWNNVGCSIALRN
jgi:hypothetical protein